MMRSRSTSRRAAFISALFLAGSAAARPFPDSSPQAANLPRVLFFANPMNSDNDVIRRPQPEVLSVAERHFMEITREVFLTTVTQDGAEVSREKLKDYDAVVFFTAINPPGVDKEGLIEWVGNGGAFAGIHSTANTYQNFPPFGEMLGAYYDRRPWRTKEKPRTKVRVRVNDGNHPSTRHLGDSFEIEDDIYQFKNFDPANVRILLRLDAASLDLTNPRMNREDTHLPVSWVKSFHRGRVFYTSLGDGEGTWRSSAYRTHLIKGIQWTLRRDE
jgi:type 1 glutamine amidotransferase